MLRVSLPSRGHETGQDEGKMIHVWYGMRNYVQHLMY